MHRHHLPPVLPQTSVDTRTPKTNMDTKNDGLEDDVLFQRGDVSVWPLFPHGGN